MTQKDLIKNILTKFAFCDKISYAELVNEFNVANEKATAEALEAVSDMKKKREKELHKEKVAMSEAERIEALPWIYETGIRDENGTHKVFVTKDFNDALGVCIRSHNNYIERHAPYTRAGKLIDLIYEYDFAGTKKWTEVK